MLSKENLTEAQEIICLSPYLLYILTFSAVLSSQVEAFFFVHELQKQNLIGIYALSKVEKMQIAKSTCTSYKYSVIFNILHYY